MKVVELKDVEVTYQGRDRPSLKVDYFSVEEGETVLIVGKSGSGKSTLVNVINGVIPNLISAEVKGEVRVFGRDPRKTPIHETAELIGTVLQDPEMQTISQTVMDEIAFGPENLMLSREEIWERVVESSKLAGVYDLLDRETRTLSGGELQRTVLASVLAMRPKALILDEPTSNIDPEGTDQIFSLLKRFKEEGRTMIVVEHKLDRLLRFADRVVLVDGGRLVFDVPKGEIIRRAHDLVKAGVEVPEYFLHLSAGKPLSEFVYAPPPRRRGEEVVLKARVRVWHAKTKREIVNASLTLRKGEVIALMGRNGAGKSTLLKALVGLLDKDLKSEVELWVNGVDLSDEDLTVRGAYIGYLPQTFDVMFVKRTVREEVAFPMKARRAYDESRLNEVLKSFSLYDIANDDPLLLSMGQRRRVAMASVLASGAKVLLMDEPTSGQDWYHRETLGSELRELAEDGYSILVVTHDSRFVDKFCDWVLVMDKGRVVAEGKPEEIFQKEGLGVSPPSEYLVMRHGTVELPL